MEKVSGMQEVTFQFLAENKMSGFDIDNYVFTKIFSDVLMRGKVSPINRKVEFIKLDPRVEISNPYLKEEDRKLVFLLMEKGVVRYTINII